MPRSSRIRGGRSWPATESAGSDERPVDGVSASVPRSVIVPQFLGLSWGLGDCEATRAHVALLGRPEQPLSPPSVTTKPLPPMSLDTCFSERRAGDNSPRPPRLHTMERTTMGIIAFIILCLLAGIIAKAILPGNDPGGLIITTIIGIVGALLGGFLAAALFDAHPLDDFFDISTWVTAIIGSIILLAIYRAIANRGGHGLRV